MKQFSGSTAVLVGGVLLLAGGTQVWGAPGNDTGNIDTVVIERATIPAELMMRVRITAIEPAAPSEIKFRFGGEALGGEVVSGSLGKEMAVGQWTAPVSLAAITQGKASKTFFLTVTGGSMGKEDRGSRRLAGFSKNVWFEFEFSANGKVLKTFTGAGPDGGTVGLVIPVSELDGGKPVNSPSFVAGLGTLLDYSRGRAEALKKLPWSGGALPRKFSMVTDLGGYGESMGYGIRHTDPAIIESEAQTLREMGVNGLRAAPEFLVEKALKGEGYAAAFNRVLLKPSVGFPVVQYRKDRDALPDAGCPYGAAVAGTTRQLVDESLARLLALPVPEVWGLTVDEIGSVFDGTPEGKPHMATCERCAEAYREFLKGRNLTPGDFGAKAWAEIRPVNAWSKDPNSPKPWLTDPNAALNFHYTHLFNNYSTAKLFTPLRDAYAAANKKKREAIEGGKLQSAEAKQPWIYSYALRGNTFLLGGHSLDFFNFYRSADNAFVYETSNRDNRVLGWDSYLCDVGRTMAAEQNLQLGIYIKPHRGAPIQRALTAISRGFKMIYWYTYGPDYFKGDSFSDGPELLAQTSQAAHLIAKAEDELYDSEWVQPAEVAIVKPDSLVSWGTDAAAIASWEDAKWTYSALTSSHIPVDAIDEEILTTRDLSKYKAIYVLGPNLTRAAARKLEAYVKAGGVLYTNAGGVSRDEANQPLKVLAPTLGLKERNPVDMWFKVQTYASTALQPYPDGKRAELAPVPAEAVVRGSTPFPGEALSLTMGREVLNPGEGTEVLARFANGAAAVTRSHYGKGMVYVSGFFPGLEYSVPVRGSDFDMDRDFGAVARAFVAAPVMAAGVKPVVDANEPQVEGVLLRNKKTGARSVTLMNWGYKVTGRRVIAGRTSLVTKIIPRENLKVMVRGAGTVREVRSAWTGQVLPVTRQGDSVMVTVPDLVEGDVLILK